MKSCIQGNIVTRSIMVHASMDNATNPTNPTSMGMSTTQGNDCGNVFHTQARVL